MDGGDCFHPFLFVNLAEIFGKIMSVGKLVCWFFCLFVNLAKILARLFRSVSWFVCFFVCMDVYMFVCLSTLFFRSVDINSRRIFIIFGQMVKG